MKKRHDKQRTERSISGFDHASSSTDFYSTSPSERPLSDNDGGPSDSIDARQTGRHQAVSTRRTEKLDPREKMALMAILRLAVLVFAIAIAFFMLRKGIGLYEESIWLDHDAVPEKSPVLREVSLAGDFDVRNQESHEQFSERIALWKEADRLVRSADALLRRKNYDQAIEQCQEALRHDPAHRGALERLGRLYYAKGDHVEAVNAYIRLLSVDPSDEKTQKRLIEALDAFGDYHAVKYMAEWYLEQNTYDVNVQRYLANALYTFEDFGAVAEAYGRVLRESPRDVLALERQAAAYMQLRQYEKALVPLVELRKNNFKNPAYPKKIAVCQAQLGQGLETTLTLARAGQLFGQQTVLNFIQDPQFDPVREERVFQAFIDRVGGKEFRLGMEELMRRAKEEEAPAGVDPLLGIPDTESQVEGLLESVK